MDAAPKPTSPTDVAAALGRALDERGQDYAFGGAVALAYWAEPRTTMDVDLTLFLSPDRPTDCIRTLQILRHRLPNFDREWVRIQLVEICGARDIRVARWDEAVKEVQP